jgi:AraC family transcriptional regulator of adaptative response/methylated-DNA-[protein]-cysteine methyltransferase
MMNEQTEDAMLDTAAPISADRDPRWQAVITHDRAADGSFYYSVASTGVYCRPSCPSRQPKPENVAYHLSCEDAERAGYRACKRCKPNEASLSERHAAIIARICRVILASEEVPNLDELAEKAGLSRYHFHRLFKSITGLTPGAYARANRADRVRTELAKPDTSVTSAIYAAGFNSHSRFYETSEKLLGMTPRDFKQGGRNAEIRFAVAESSLGAVLVAQSERGICAILLGDDPDVLTRELQDRFPKANLIGGDAEFEKLVAKVLSFVEAPALGLDLPLDLQGTAFQQRVWQALRSIPPGETTTYAEIARKIGAPKSVRAVGAACGANPVAIAVPCHRVVRTDGGLSGYRWGVDKKRALIARERD